MNNKRPVGVYTQQSILDRLDEDNDRNETDEVIDAESAERSTQTVFNDLSAALKAFGINDMIRTRQSSTNHRPIKNEMKFEIIDDCKPNSLKFTGAAAAEVKCTKTNSSSSVAVGGGIGVVVEEETEQFDDHCVHCHAIIRPQKCSAADVYRMRCTNKKCRKWQGPVTSRRPARRCAKQKRLYRYSESDDDSDDVYYTKKPKSSTKQNHESMDTKSMTKTGNLIVLRKRTTQKQEKNRNVADDNEPLFIRCPGQRQLVRLL